MDPTVIDAIRTGDLETVRRHRDAVPWDDSEVDARAFGAEVLRHGRPGFVELLFEDGYVPTGTWGDIDPVVWAADHGVCQLLEGLLLRRPVPEVTLRRALDAAGAWLDVDPETELRRRAGAAADEAVTIERDHVIVHDLLPRAPRIRLTAAGGRSGEVLLAHRGAITVLEAKLDLPVSRDELLARALWSADPESQDWSKAGSEMRRRYPMQANAHWAIGRLADPDLAVRRFTAELMHHLTLDGDGPDEPYAPQALAGLLARIAVEPDSAAMSDLIAAYAGFRQIGEILYELLPYATDPRPDVRSRVAADVLNGAGGPADAPPSHVLGALLDLAHDPDPTVRMVATAELAHGLIDTPELREALAAHLAGDDRRVRIDAATGLALRGDAEALEQLRRLSSEEGYESHAWYQLDFVERTLGLPSM